MLVILSLITIFLFVGSILNFYVFINTFRDEDTRPVAVVSLFLTFLFLYLGFLIVGGILNEF